MTGTRQVILHVRPVLYGRMDLRAREKQYDLHEWVLRAVIGELIRLQNEDDRRAHEALAAQSALPVARPTNERNTHAPHP